MKPEQRPAFAAIAAALVNQQKSSSVYDYAAGRYVSIRVDVAGDQLRAYDYSRSAHLSGSAKSVYDYGTGAHVQFRQSGATVSGYDYGTGQHFQARVSGRAVSLYDYGAGKHFSFSVT